MRLWNSLFTQSIRTLSVLFSAVLASTSIAQASDGFHTRHMIEVGTGMEGAIGKDSFGILLRVGYSYNRLAEDSLPGEITGPEQLIWAHFSGDFSISPWGDPNAGLPYMNIHFTPVKNSLEIIRDNGDAIMGELRALPIQIKRDIRIDQNAMVKVSLAGVQFGLTRFQSDQMALIAQVAVDLLGYKMSSYVSERGAFHGGHIGGIAAEGGAAYLVNEDFLVRLVIGGEADLNLGGNQGGGFAVNSDLAAYVALKADLYRFLQLFLKLTYFGNCNSANSYGCDGAAQLIGGITVLF